MAIHHGKGGVAKIGTAIIENITKWSVSESVETVDTTVMGASAQTHLVGIPDWSGSLDAYYDPADTDGQVALSIGASVALNLYDDGVATGKKYKSGTASITGISLDADMGGIVKVSFSFKGNGALATSTAA